MFSFSFCVCTNRSTVSKIFGPAKYGESLCAVATLQQFAQTVAIIVFPHVYSAVLTMDITIDGIIENNFGPRLVFGLIPACGALLALLAAWSLPPLNHLGEVEVPSAKKGEGKALLEPPTVDGSVQQGPAETHALLRDHD